MKLNTNISVENIVTIIALVCSMTLAFGFMQYDIDLIKEELDLKASKRQSIADRELIAYKLDVMDELGELCLFNDNYFRRVRYNGCDKIQDSRKRIKRSR